MGWRAWLKIVLGVALALNVVLEVKAKQPVFVSWLVADDPGDQTILHYWERYDLGELSPTEMVDLGTMLFYRGYPKDAIRVLEAALDQDEGLNEAWFRIGLVEHQQGNIRDARIAYKRCLKLLKGHGWCNFYLGLLEEQDGHGKKAMEYYRAAFRYAPTLADREINPEMNSSDLSLGAWLMMAQDNAFKNALPMPLLHPNRVKKVKETFRGDSTRPAGGQTTEKQNQAADPAAAKSDQKSSSSAGAATLVPVKNLSKASKSRPSHGTKTQQSKKPKSTVTPTAPTPVPAPPDDTETPYGLPGNRGVSSDAYPGF